MISAEAVGWVAIYCLAGPMMIMLNSHAINKAGFPFPITFSAMGIWGSAIVGQIAVALNIWPVHKKLTWPEYAKQVLPNAIVAALTMAVGNSVYAYLSVSFTQMLKALTPVYILLILAPFGLKTPGSRTILAITIISFGTAVASLGELKFSVTGFLLQTAADIFEGARLVMIQLLMSSYKFTPFETIYYVFPAISVFQIMMVWHFESNAFSEPSIAVMMSQWYLFLASISLGFVVNFTGANVIRQTSGLTFKVIGVIRNNFLVLLSVTLFGDATTGLQMFGYCISLIGFAWYTKLEQEAQPVAYEKVGEPVKQPV